MALTSVTATIPAGESLSSAADCSAGIRVARIITPDTWPNNDISFELSVDNVNFHPLFHVDPKTFFSFEIYAPHVPAGVVLTLPAELGSNVAWAKIRSGTKNLPVPVTVDQTFQLVLEMP
jgi:hypothetical protein